MVDMSPRATATATAITIRPAYADDELALVRLAALDSAEIPSRPLVLAEVEGELRAALSLRDGAAIADPFHPSLDVIELLRVHAAAMRGQKPRAPRRRRLALRLAT